MGLTMNYITLFRHHQAGSNDKKNLVLLTAREHYLCHWLLVKRNEVGSVARKKMLKAWLIMSASCSYQERPKINMNTYDKYKNELSKVMSESQSGEKNSQWGKRWYTNIDTGESKQIRNNKDPRWLLGKNVFEKQKIYSLKTKTPKYTAKGFFKIQKDLEEKQKLIKEWTIQKWNEYHNSNCSSINNFCKNGFCEVTWVALTNRFKMYIPIYNKLACQGRNFPPDKNLINVYDYPQANLVSRLIWVQEIPGSNPGGQI